MIKNLSELNHNEIEEIAAFLKIDYKNIIKLIECKNICSFASENLDDSKDNPSIEISDDSQDINFQNIEIKKDLKKSLAKKKENFKFNYKSDLKSDQISKKLNSNRETIRQKKIIIYKKIANYLNQSVY